MRDDDEFRKVVPIKGKGSVLGFEQNDRAAVVEAVGQLLARHVATYGRLPASMPDRQDFAAAWFVDYLLEPKEPHEAAFRKGEGICAPYRDRIVQLAGRFLGLDEGFRRYIVAARQDGVYWRGDDQATFPGIAAETIAYKSLDADGKAAYRRRLVGAARRLSGQMQVDGGEKIDSEPLCQP